MPSFMAPELLLPTKFGLERVRSKEADMYALGMTIYQVLTSRQPFLQRRKARIIHAVISGERPAKPENAEEIGMTKVVWDLLEECWKEDRTMRPNASDVLGRLRDGRTTADSTIEMGGSRRGDRDATPSKSTPAQREWNDSPSEHLYPILRRHTNAVQWGRALAGPSLHFRRRSRERRPALGRRPAADPLVPRPRPRPRPLSPGY